jgi:hypothetical protein
VSGAILLFASLSRAGQPPPLVPCYFKEVTGAPCPFCGLTRSFTHAGHGYWADAWHEAPLGAVLYALVALTFLVSAWALMARRRVVFTLPERWHASRVALWLAVLAVIANWCYRLAAGLR